MGLFRRTAEDGNAVLFHARADARRAKAIVARLRDRGIPMSACEVDTAPASLNATEDQARGAKCLVVAWSAEGPAQDVLREIAHRAKARGQLVTVSFPDAEPPLGFSDHPPLDFMATRIKPGVIDSLASACAEKLGATLPRRRRWWFRIGAGFASVFTVTVAITGFDLLNAQEQFCRIPNLQPGISDFCGFAGMGDRPTREERIAWEAWDKRSCKALEDHISAFPDGKFAGAATALLATKKSVVTGKSVSVTHVLPLYVPVDAVIDGSEEASKRRALARGAATAKRQCQLYATDVSGAYVQATPIADQWQCADGACSLEGHSKCVVNQPELEDVCISTAP